MKWAIDEPLVEHPEAVAELAELARQLEEFVTDDFRVVTEIGLRRHHGVVQTYAITE